MAQWHSGYLGSDFILVVHGLFLHFAQCLAPRKMLNKYVEWKNKECNLQNARGTLWLLVLDDSHCLQGLAFLLSRLLPSLCSSPCSLNRLYPFASQGFCTHRPLGPVNFCTLGPSIWHPVGTQWLSGDCMEDYFTVRNDVLVRVVWTSLTSR